MYCTQKNWVLLQHLVAHSEWVLSRPQKIYGALSRLRACTIHTYAACCGGWSTGLYTPHFPSLTLLGKVLYLLCQVFQSRKTLEYCIPFFTILYFQSLNIEELLNLESSKLSVLFLVILAGFPTKCCVFVTGNGMEHSESVNNNKMSSAFRNIVWAYSSSNIFLIPVCNFIDISTGPMTVTNSIGEASYTL